MNIDMKQSKGLRKNMSLLKQFPGLMVFFIASCELFISSKVNLCLVIITSSLFLLPFPNLEQYALHGLVQLDSRNFECDPE